MKFYDRKKEIAELRSIDDRAEECAQFTVLMGRRRTGKTTLVMHALSDRKENSVCKESLLTAADAKNYRTKYYNLDVIISASLKDMGHTLSAAILTGFAPEDILLRLNLNGSAAV